MISDIHELRALGDRAQQANERAKQRQDETDEVYARAVEDVLRFVAGDAKATEELAAVFADPVPPTLTVREIHYLARCVDLGRSDPEASSILPPDERSALLRKLGGRRS